MPDKKKDSVLRLPTARAVHDDTGFPFSSILEVYPYQEIRTLRNHLDELPFPIKKEADVGKTIIKYEEQIVKYEKKFSTKGSAVRRKWDTVKAQYKAALEAELRSTQEDHEYGVILPAKFQKYRKEKREKLISYLKPIFNGLEDSQKRKLAHYFNGYAGLFQRPFCNCDLLFECVSIMTESAKAELKQYIRSIEPELNRSEIYFLSENIAWCQKIRTSNSGTELHKGPENTWEVLKNKINRLKIGNDDSDYGKMLGIALLIDLLGKSEIIEPDLEIIMDHALFLNRYQAGGVLEKALDMLIPENIKPEIVWEQVQQIRRELENEKRVGFNDTAILGRLEQHFGLILENEIFQ